MSPASDHDAGLRVEGVDVGVLALEEAGELPVYATVATKDSKGRFGTEEKFFIRRNNATRAIDDGREVERYVAERWGPT